MPVPPIPPVLLVVFNRPETTRQVLESLAVARPPRLFVAADGPRPDVPPDESLCAEVQALVSAPPWPCDVTVRTRPGNLGLQRSMVDALLWFFGSVEEGVVLEDDCVVHPDFLRFAGTVLDRHRETDRLMSVSAVNLAPGRVPTGASWFTARAGNVWGWATWRRAVEGFDGTMADWSGQRDAFLRDPTPLKRALARKFDAAHDGTKYTWARAWHHHVAVHDGLVAVPAVNMVRNVGFGTNATHTRSTRHRLASLTASPLPDPIVDPDDLDPDPQYERAVTRHHSWSRRRRVREWVRRRAVRTRGATPS